MSTDKSADEKPKRKVAKDVVSKKRQYFVPTHKGGHIEADNPEDAVSKAKELAEAEATESGDE